MNEVKRSSGAMGFWYHIIICCFGGIEKKTELRKAHRTVGVNCLGGYILISFPELFHYILALPIFKEKVLGTKLWNPDFFRTYKAWKRKTVWKIGEKIILLVWEQGNDFWVREIVLPCGNKFFRVLLWFLRFSWCFPRSAKIPRDQIPQRFTAQTNWYIQAQQVESR